MPHRPRYLPSMLASAMMHYGRRSSWVVATRKPDGVRFVTFESSRKDPRTGLPKLYRTKGDGTWCTCPGFSYHGDVCSHTIAVIMDNESDRRHNVTRIDSRTRRAEIPATRPERELVDAF